MVSIACNVLGLKYYIHSSFKKCFGGEFTSLPPIFQGQEIFDV
jgi:hypothetical protein